MAKLSLAIAAVFFAAMTAFAAAEGPSYESRGYGGPLYVGPNFQEGGQHAPPVYDTNPSSREPHKRKRSYEVTKSPAARRERQTDTAKSAPEKSAPEKDEVESENSTIALATTGADDTAKSAPEKSAPGKDEAESENSSITLASTGADHTAKSAPGRAHRGRTGWRTRTPRSRAPRPAPTTPAAQSRPQPGPPRPKTRPSPARPSTSLPRIAPQPPRTSCKKYFPTAVTTLTVPCE